MEWISGLLESFEFTWWQAGLILVAGVWAGLINTIVGSGTLVTFPVLVTMGVPPVTATMSNAMGLIAGNLTGAWNYRAELRGLRGTLLKLLPCSIAGGAIGAGLLMVLPEEVFSYVAPVLIVVALFFVVFQPKLQGIVRQRKEAQAQEIADAARAHGEEPAQLDPDSLPQPSILYVLVFIAGIYGGYFVAAQGVLLLGILGVFLLASMQSANAVKIFLVAAVNIVAAVSYILFSFERIDWWVVVLIAISSSVGSWLGAKVGRRLSPVALRTVIVVLGLAALANMVRQVL
ncbi:sulfite exporter TauE/SafE family protein [Kocuria sp. p3-SID1433]|uniref:sulfite exporter TauE/SafE family protein n=1 Tax=unclassified Kocuria TaxID=2649579 RepID=UPI0021A5A8BF|nr:MULTISPECIES: sulfite exporter TauE/SafE family protein [unclassified Kocuria]MCT1602927.1 sulfite exporter TauE/SafE family protein [Kocuria sp. p3-SID1428]MCT2180923.1 sulfite exporter TauE/SafE family protein [Kocuria sp. p3-SID1433]